MKTSLKLIMLAILFLVTGCNSSQAVNVRPSFTQNLTYIVPFIEPSTIQNTPPAAAQTTVVQAKSPTATTIQTTLTQNTVPGYDYTQSLPIDLSDVAATQYLINLEIILNPMIKNWQGVIARQPSPQKLTYSTNLVFISGAYMPRFHFSLDIMKKYVDALKQAGITRIDLNPSLGPWLKTDSQS